MSTQKPALKNAITQILSCALQPYSEIQRLTEERKKALEMIDDYPFILLEIIQSKDEAYAEKLMAATFLKNYILDMYRVKEMVSLNRNLRQKLSLELVEMLSYENDVVRQMLSSSLELLVINEYPNNFNLINNKIMSFLLSENLYEISGAVEFMKGLGSNHKSFCNEKMYFPPEYIEPLLNVLHNENFPIELRASTVACMVEILISCRKTQLFTGTNARLTDVFQKLLTAPYSHSNNFHLKGEIILEISNAVVYLHKDVVDMVSCCLPAIGEIMFNCCLEYKQIIMGHKQIPRDLVGESDNFRKLVINILVLINTIFLLPNYSALLTDCLNDFIYLLFILMCAYDNNEDSLFTEDDIKHIPETDYSLRGRCGHILLVFMDQCEYDKFSSVFHSVLQKHITEANLARQNSELYYYRILEVLMYGLGLLSYIFGELESNFLYYVELWSSMLIEPQQPHWLVLARLLWLGSKLSVYLAPVTLSNHLNAIITHFNSQNESLRIACIGAMRTHLLYLKSNPNHMIFSNRVSDIKENLLTMNVCSSEMTVMCLQSMSYLFEYSPDSVRGNAERIMQILLDSILTHFSNTKAIKEVNTLLSIISANINCKEIIKNNFIPFTLKLIYKNCPSPLNQKTDVCERGLELLNTVIKFYPDSIEDNVILQSFCKACISILEFNDSSVMEIATIYVSNLLMKASYRIKSLRDSKGKLLADYIPDILFKLLEPYPQETVCPSKFGRLCVITIMTLPEQIEPCIESILKALLSALQRTDSIDPIKSYCFIFAYMFMWQTSNIINFLCSIPGPDGCSALAYFLNKWQVEMLICEKFEKNIITLAICKMIEYSLTKNDDRINDCRILLQTPFIGDCSGLEKLYLLLINMFLFEVDEQNKFYNEKIDEAEKDDVLIKNHPVCNLDLIEHIKGFITNYSTIHYISIVKKLDQNYIMVLEKNGLKPNNL